MKKSRAGEISLLLIWTSSLLFGLYRGGASAWFLFYSMSGIVIYCICVHVFMLTNVEAERHMSRSRFFEGEAATVTISLRQRSYLPLIWLIVQDEWVHGGRTQRYSYNKMMIPWLRRTLSFTYQIE